MIVSVIWTTSLQETAIIVIILNKLRFNQISGSGRSGSR